MLKLAIPAVIALLVASAPTPARAAHCKCHAHKAAHVHKAAPKKAKWVARKRVTTTTTVERTVHYSPPQVIERVRHVEVPVYVDRPVPVERQVYVDRPVYVERPVYIDRPVYVERRVAVPVYRTVPVYRPVAVYPRPVYRRAAYHHPYHGRHRW